MTPSELFVDCVLWLAEEALESFESLDPVVFSDINVMNAESFERVLRATPDPRQETPGLLALGASRGKLPLLHVAFGTEHDQSILRLTLVLVGTDSYGQVGTAWRFESPEGPGEHCFWHCQPVRTLRGGGQVPCLDRRLPQGYFDDIPTMPLAVTHPDGLLVAMLVAVYGHKTFDRMQQDGFGDRLDTFLKELDAGAAER